MKKKNGVALNKLLRYIKWRIINLLLSDNEKMVIHKCCREFESKYVLSLGETIKEDCDTAYLVRKQIKYTDV